MGFACMAPLLMETWDRLSFAWDTQDEKRESLNRAASKRKADLNARRYEATKRKRTKSEKIREANAAKMRRRKRESLDKWKEEKAKRDKAEAGERWAKANPAAVKRFTEGAQKRAEANARRERTAGAPRTKAVAAKKKAENKAKPRYRPSSNLDDWRHK